MNLILALSTFAIGFAAGILTMWGAAMNTWEVRRKQKANREKLEAYREATRQASKRLGESIAELRSKHEHSNT